MCAKAMPLIDIDSRPYEAQLAQAQGALTRDQNLLAEAQMDLKRYQDAWAKNAIPRQTLEDQEKLVLQDQGTVQNDQGTVQYDEVQVGFCHILSPIDGRVGLRLVDPGNLVTANSTTPLVVVTQIHPITVIFTLAEDSLPEVLKQTHTGKALEVDASDRTQQTLLAKGKLITINNQIDTVTGTVKLRAQFDNSNGMLFPNQFVNTRLLVKTLDNQTLIPSSAVQHNGSVDYVYLIQNKKAVMRNVKSGISDKGNTAVTGINPGDVVANSSFQKLVNGSTISISKVNDSGHILRYHRGLLHEPIPAIHPAAGCYLAADGRNSAGWAGRFFQLPGIGACRRWTTRRFRWSPSIPAPARTL